MCQARYSVIPPDRQGSKLVEESPAQALTLSLHELFHQALDLWAFDYLVQ
jgi:hypothetical protein